MMKRILKWLGIGIGSIAALALCAAAYLFIASQRVVARTYDAPLGTFNAPSDAQSVRKGERLATIYGCNNCHGKDLAGTDMFDKPGIAHITAPNLTAFVKDYTDAELERLIRRGIKSDGRSAWIMPSSMYANLTDDDLGAITAYVRNFPQTEGIERKTQLRLLGRVGILTGQLEPQAAKIESLQKTPPPTPADPLSQGRYLVMTACTECHGANLQGWPFLGSPSLVAAAAYPSQNFAHLMRTGIGLGDRNLGLMTEVGKERFSSFTNDEVTAIHTYLQEFARQGGSTLP